MIRRLKHYCMVYSVIGNASGYPINTKFLDVMHKNGFSKKIFTFNGNYAILILEGVLYGENC